MTLRELGDWLSDEFGSVAEWFESGACALTFGKTCGQELGWLDLTLGQALFTIVVVPYTFIMVICCVVIIASYREW